MIKTMRKGKKVIKILSVLLFLTVVATSTGVTPVLAGLSGGYVVDEGKLKGEELSIAEWMYDRNGVGIENGTILFDENYDLENPVLARTEVRASEEVRIALDVSFKITIDDMAGDKRFGFGYGIERLNQDVTDDGATFFYFQKDEDGYSAGLETRFNGEEKTLQEPKHIASEIDMVPVRIKVTWDGKVSILISGKSFYSSTAAETSATGFLGFSSTGEWTDEENYVVAKIHEMTAYNEFDSKPEAPLLSIANFDNNEFNTNEWTIANFMVPNHRGIVAENNALRFDGVCCYGTFGTMHRYSNFELQFDVFDVRNKAYVDDAGNKVGASYWLMASWGRTGEDGFAVAANQSFTYAVVFDFPLNMDENDPNKGERRSDRSMVVGFYAKGENYVQYTIPEKFAFMAPEFEERVRVKMTNVDGKFVLSMKLVEEAEYTDIFVYEYPNGLMPEGFIALRGGSNRWVPNLWNNVQNFSEYTLDNIMLKNMDNNPNAIEVDYQSNRLTFVPDYIYYDHYTDDYLVSHTGGKRTN